MLRKLGFLLIVLLFTNYIVFSQDTSLLKNKAFDSLQNLNGLAKKVNHLSDSVLKKSNTKNKADSLNQTFNKSILKIKDSLSHKFTKLKTDSIKIDSLKHWHRLKESNVLGNNLSEIDKKKKMDSLSNIFNQENKKLSVERDKHLKEAQVTQKKLTEKVNDWSDKLKNLLPNKDTLGNINEFGNQELLNERTNVLDQDFSLNNDVKIPKSEQLINTQLNVDKDLDNQFNQKDLNINTELGQKNISRNLPTDQNPDTKLQGNLQVEELVEIKSKLKEIEVLKSELSISKIKLDSIQRASAKEQATKKLEEEAKDFVNDEVGNSLEQNAEMSPAKLEEVRNMQAMARKYEDKDFIQKQMAMKAKTVALEEMAKQSPALLKAQTALTKTQSKYRQFNSYKDVQKNKLNALKGKSFIERFCPGVTLQVSKKEDLEIFIAPGAVYRLTGRISVGTYFVYKSQMRLKPSFEWLEDRQAYGGKVVGRFTFGKGFLVQYDYERLSAHQYNFSTKE
ncbi:MAG: hypothetical protein O9294_18585, partial [Cytophagales bacterium]|nr:hypothetical protein [Cytophagales bacterium]